MKCPEATDPRMAIGNIEIDRIPERIDEDFLKKLHYRLKAAIIANNQSKA